MGGLRQISRKDMVMVYVILTIILSIPFMILLSILVYAVYGCFPIAKIGSRACLAEVRQEIGHWVILLPSLLGLITSGVLIQRFRSK